MEPPMLMLVLRPKRVIFSVVLEIYCVVGVDCYFCATTTRLGSLKL